MEGKDVISGSAFADIISGSRRTVLAVHTHPDGDAIGCGTGLLHFIREVLGKRAVLAVPDAIPDNLLFLLEGLGDSVLVHDSRPEETEKAIAEADLIIGMDISGFDRTGPLKSFLHSSKARKILIDHHLNPDTDAFDVAFSDTEVSSTCELLYRILSDTVQIHGDASLLPLHAATALMTGMTTDTNNFANSVFPGTLRMASDLLSSGVDREMIIDNVYHAYRVLHGQDPACGDYIAYASRIPSPAVNASASASLSGVPSSTLYVVSTAGWSFMFFPVPFCNGANLRDVPS